MVQSITMPPGFGGQERLEAALHMPDPGSDGHIATIQKVKNLGGEKGLDHIFDQYGVDAIVVASEIGRSQIWACLIEYPVGTVPLGYPDIGLPYGLLFIARKNREDTLISLM